MKPFRMTMSDGSLHIEYRPLVITRPNYSMHHRQINSTHDMRATLRAGKYTILGSYPLYFITSDGAALCFACARQEYRQISTAIKHKLKDGWRVVGCEINEEDCDLTCDHCSERIEATYADEEEKVEVVVAEEGQYAYEPDEFNSYLTKCTAMQIRGVLEKELNAGRLAYVALVRAEAERRGITLD